MDIAEEEIEETKKSQTQIDRLVGNVKKINYIIPEEKKVLKRIKIEKYL